MACETNFPDIRLDLGISDAFTGFDFEQGNHHMVMVFSERNCSVHGALRVFQRMALEQVGAQYTEVNSYPICNFIAVEVACERHSGNQNEQCCLYDARQAS